MQKDGDNSPLLLGAPLSHPLHYNVYKYHSILPSDIFQQRKSVRLPMTSPFRCKVKNAARGLKAI